ncbi:MAG: 3-dehydroquinate synthase [Gammaproteobacteria bacterium]
MHGLRVELGDRSYPVLVGREILGDPTAWSSLMTAPQVLVVTNEVVSPLWLEPALAGLGDRQVATLTLPDGERYKTLETLSVVFDTLAEHGFHRDAAILALGGGVVGDLAGFAAACWQRGVDVFQAPTTLLAQVDASVGGKTAVNHPAGKNLIGAFHQPRAVVADVATLATLPDREFRAGLGEVIKYGLGLDAQLFDWLESRLELLVDRDPQVLERAVFWCCSLKAEVVAGDEREAGRRALLNLGHTFGHAIEAATEFSEWLHGEAVGAGLVMACRLAAADGAMSGEDADRVEAMVRAAGLPVAPPPVGSARLRSLMGMDKKVSGGRLRLVVPDGIGSCRVRDDVPGRLLDAVLAEADRDG